MDQIQQIQEEALAKIAAAQNLEVLQQVRIAYLGKKGSIQALMSRMKDLSKEEKPAFGQKVNLCKQTVTEALEQREAKLQSAALGQQLEQERIDITLPGDNLEAGTVHPLILVQQEIEDLFVGMSTAKASAKSVWLLSWTDI